MVKYFDFNFRLAGKDCTGSYTIKLKDNELEGIFVNFEDAESDIFWENEHLFDYNRKDDSLIMTPMQPSMIEVRCSVVEAIVSLEFLGA